MEESYMNSTISRKAAIYCRLANADTERIERQEEELLKYAEQNGYKERACYRDNGENGLSLERPGMQNLINDIKDGKINTVIAYNLNRVARGRQPMVQWLQILKEYGTEFISVSDGCRFPGDDIFIDPQTFARL
jgi:site-specific DNA recombinase